MFDIARVDMVLARNLLGELTPRDPVADLCLQRWWR